MTMVRLHLTIDEPWDLADGIPIVLEGTRDEIETAAFPDDEFLLDAAAGSVLRGQRVRRVKVASRYEGYSLSPVLSGEEVIVNAIAYLDDDSEQSLTATLSKPC